MKKILVTGGSGFIGSHMCLLLLERGYKVLAVDSFHNSSPNSLDNVLEICDKKKSTLRNNLNLIKSDLRDKKSIQKIFKVSKKDGEVIQGVIHFAGIKSVSESVRNPLLYWHTNLTITINLLQVMSENNCKTIVFSSSATVYGKSEKKLIKESDPLKPINPYGNSKYATELILNDAYQSSEREWSISNLRYFNPIGNHESGLIGECPLLSPTNIFPLILNVGSGELQNLIIYGDDWNTIDGTGVRDYIHVLDLVDGHLLALEFLLNNRGKYINLNLGTGQGTSVLELINSFQETNKIKIPYQISKRRNGDIEHCVADNKLATTLLSWTPKRNIQDMCRDGWKWKKDNPYGFE